MILFENSLNQVEKLEKIVLLLERGIRDRHDAFHNAALATISSSGEPEARTVICRRLLRDPLSLVCHIDSRSPKAAEISNNQKVSWLFYHPAEKLQLRFRATAFLHTNDWLAEEQWRNSSLFSKRSYCGAAPTSEVGEPSSGLPDFLEKRQPTEEEANDLGRKSFAVVRCAAREMDVYELSAGGHRRALFRFRENGVVEIQWLTP